MKRIFLFTLLLCASTVVSVAQKKEYFKQKKHELRLSYGSVNDSGYYDYFRYGNYYASGYGNYYGSNGLNNPNSLTSSSYMGATRTTGVISGSYFYNMSSLRFSFGGALSYSGYTTDYKDRITDKKVGHLKGHNIAFTPTVRYSWVAKENFRFYSGVGLSLYYDLSNYKLNNTSNGGYSIKENHSNFSSALMITPVGFSYGKDIFVFGELNLGGRVGNFTGGVGYRF